MIRTAQRTMVSTVMAVMLAAAVPGLAQGASSTPVATTGAVANVTQTTVTLQGKVDPNGARTTYFFQYGPTAIYGAQTAVVAAGSGANPVNVTADVTGLTPFTTYHYRLVASNRNGLIGGADRKFKTKRQPLGLALGATPNPVPFGRPTILAGQLTGTGNSGRQVVLQSNPFPYTQGFVATTNVQLTDAQGNFSFPLLSVALNTQFRVQVPDKPEVTSPIVGVGVAVRVSTNVSATRVRRGRFVRFFGTLKPARPGAQFAIQKLGSKGWVTVAGGVTRTSTASASKYAKRVRIRRGGTFRVFIAIVDGNYVSNAGREVRIGVR